MADPYHYDIKWSYARFRSQLLDAPLNFGMQARYLSTIMKAPNLPVQPQISTEKKLAFMDNFYYFP